MYVNITLNQPVRATILQTVVSDCLFKAMISSILTAI